MENRERQLHLRFDANGADDQALAALAGEVLQERRLAHPGLPAHDERAALSTTHRAQEFIEPRTLAGTATKHRSRILGTICCEHGTSASVGEAADLPPELGTSRLTPT